MSFQEYNFELLADYFQFYLQDENSLTDTATIWTEENSKRMLAVGDGVVGVGTVRNMTVPVRITIQANEPAVELEKWDKINECSLTVNSGKIVVMGCTDDYSDAARITVQPGVYRVRVYYGSLNKLSEDGLEGEDHYELTLWPDTEERPVKELK